MLDLRLVFKRLEEKVPNLTSLGDAIDLAAAEELESVDQPSAYLELQNMVALDETDSGLVPLKGKARQYIVARFSVTVVANNHRYASSSSVSTLESILEDIRNALIGWSPEMSTARPCHFESGQMKIYNSRMQVWQDNYQIRYAVGNSL